MKVNFFLTAFFILTFTSAFAQNVPPQDTTSHDSILPADDEYYINILLTESELAKVDSLVSLLSENDVLEFETKYALWLESTNVPEIQAQSNPEAYKTDEYYRFKNFTLGLGPAYIGLLISFYQNHYGVAHYILLYITFEDYGYLLDEVREEFHKPVFNEDGEQIYYQLRNLSFGNLYFKKILSLIQINKSEVIITNVKAENRLASNLSVYPNPAKTELTIQFKIPKPEHVTLKIFDLAGNEIERVRDNDFFPAGNYLVHWKRKNRIKTGMYFLVLKTKEDRLKKKFQLL